MGERLLFAVLVPPQRSDLMAYAVKLCRSVHEAEDLLQDVMVKALEAWANFRPPEGVPAEVAVRSWLYTNTYHAFCSRWRSTQRGRLVKELYIAETDQVADPRKEPTPGYSEEVVDAVAHLDPDQRKVLVLASEGMKYHEIASELGVPIGTVMSRLYRARQAMKEHLADFAAAEYSLGRESTGVDVPRSEPPQDEQPETDGVDGVVRSLDGEGFDLGEALADAEAAG